VFSSIIEGLRYAWAEPVVRALFFIICAIEFSYAGPASVGIASLARNRFDSVGALGLMLSSIGGGMVIGILLGGSIDGRRRRGPVLIGAGVAMGFALCMLGFATTLAMACGLLLLSGVGAGLTNILIMAWIQAKTRSEILGRVISLLLLGMSLTEPVSYALAGVMVSLNLKAVFVASGIFLLLASLIAITNRELRSAD
jgi:MFS family permease